MANENNTDANGRWIPSASKWPSAANGVGFKSVADKVHAMGLSFGIHIMRGIPRIAYTANSPIAGSTYKAQDAGDMTDICPWDNHNYGVRGDTPAGQAWYDSIFAQYASWGIDFVKVDDMIFHSGTYTNANYTTNVYHAAEAAAIRAAIDKSGRSIVFSLSPGPMQTKDSALLGMHANMWRMVDDFWDTKGAQQPRGRVHGGGKLADAERPFAGALARLRHVAARLHRTALSSRGRAAHERPQPRRADVGHVPLGNSAVAPHGGGNPTHLSGDTWTTALLTNPEVLAVNQDASGTHAKRVSMSGSTQVWARDLSGGRKAVALFNRGGSMATSPSPTRSLVSADSRRCATSGSEWTSPRRPVVCRPAWPGAARLSSSLRRRARAGSGGGQGGTATRTSGARARVEVLPQLAVALVAAETGPPGRAAWARAQQTEPAGRQRRVRAERLAAPVRQTRRAGTAAWAEGVQ